ncbi:MAG: hypothetical protein CMO81_00235 [Waddliaceae bacterium]|nr:hypothetical protein [Waddliaceae bacterium]|tara:strand:+ start:9465 stop:10511 length:1047 start_codon:yes stop_codon:yes gene_type:complete
MSNREEGKFQLTKGYKDLLTEIKETIKTSRLKAAISVNQGLIQMYWEIGASILKKQESEGWGAKTIEKLASDIKSSFKDMKGFSHRNLKYMVHFAKEYPDFPIGQQLVAQIPWGHNILILQKVKIQEARLWYVQKTIENGWSRNVLQHWIDSDLYQREGKALTNFSKTLPAPQSDLATQTLKDPYCFDFLTLREQFDEKELEDGLLDHLQKFLMELGQGFAFIGRQYPLTIEGDTSYLDLLFYHTRLHCYVVVELKAGAFDPRDAGQMNFYLSAVDDMLKTDHDNPTLGLLLCKGKKGLKVEYALRDIRKPIGVAEYETKIIESLPDDLKGSLPTIEELELEFEEEQE